MIRSCVTLVFLFSIFYWLPQVSAQEPQASAETLHTPVETLTISPSEHQTPDQHDPTGKTVSVEVETILATNNSEQMDERLTDIRRRLRIFRYSSYQLVQKKSQLVSWGKQANFMLPGGRFLQVVPREYVNERIGLQVMLLEGDTPTPLMSTKLSIRNRGLLFVGGREYQGGMLILKIGAATE